MACWSEAGCVALTPCTLVVGCVKNGCWWPQVFVTEIMNFFFRDARSREHATSRASRRNSLFRGSRAVHAAFLPVYAPVLLPFRFRSLFRFIDHVSDCCEGEPSYSRLLPALRDGHNQLFIVFLQRGHRRASM